jgi:hypothetical protein
MPTEEVRAWVNLGTNLIELGVLTAIWAQVCRTHRMIAATQQQLRRAVHSLGGAGAHPREITRG